MKFNLLFLIILLFLGRRANTEKFITSKSNELNSVQAKDRISLTEYKVSNHRTVESGMFNTLNESLFLISTLIIDSTDYKADFIVFDEQSQQSHILNLDKIDGRYPVEEPIGWLNDSLFLFRKIVSNKEKRENLVIYDINSNQKKQHILPKYVDEVIADNNIILFDAATRISGDEDISKPFQYTVYKYDFKRREKEAYLEFPIGERVYLINYSNKNDRLTYIYNSSLNFFSKGDTITVFKNATTTKDDKSYIEKVRPGLVCWDEPEKALYFFTSVYLSLYDEGFTGDKMYDILNRYDLTNQELERLDTLNYDVTKRVYKWRDIEITHITEMSRYHDQSFLLSVEQPYNPEETVSVDIPITFSQTRIILSGEVNPNKKLYVLDIK